ncbi:MAG: DUF4058 family protein [Planctomycetia bacterium]|nr:DUF4058 family protein [Planctomycetia bacterium]
MPVHDWSRVEAGIFHDFHHAWIEEIKRALNSGLLPDEYYAMAEQQAAGFGPDVLTLESKKGQGAGGGNASAPSSGSRGLLVAPPQVRITAESPDFFRRKKSAITVRHVSGDYIVAVVEVVSPGNKSSRSAFKALIDKACQLLEHKVHLLILDLLPPGKRDPQGLHAALWEEIADEPFTLPPDKPLTLAAYESGLTVRAYVEPVAVGDVLPDMPLFLEPGAHVPVPLEATYQAAFAAVPRRWREVVEGSAPRTN